MDFLNALLFSQINVYLNWTEISHSHALSLSRTHTHTTYPSEQKICSLVGNLQEWYFS